MPVRPADATRLYRSARPAIAHDRATLAATASPTSRCRRPPATRCAPRARAARWPLFDAGRAGGAAQRRHAGPADHARRSTPPKSVPLPPKLFSHNDQQSIWQASLPEGATSGWGGRIGDLLAVGQRQRRPSPACRRLRQHRLPLRPDRDPVPGVATGPVRAERRSSRPLFGSTRALDAAARADHASRARICSRHELRRVTQRSLDARVQLDRGAGRARRRSPRRSRPATAWPTSCGSSRA